MLLGIAKMEFNKSLIRQFMGQPSGAAIERCGNGY